MSKLTLRVVQGADRGKVFGDLTPPISIGREEGNTIQLNDERISRYHCKILLDNQHLVLTDLESTNGTKVNGQSCQLKILRFGDLILVGRSILLFGDPQQIRARLSETSLLAEKAKAEQLCIELGIQNKVIFFGNSHEIDQILSFSDLFLLPSETESFGLAALEAMAWSVPVISSNSGGLPEVNFDGVSGYLSNVGDVDSMAENAIKILTDNKTLTKFKENALDIAKQFDIKNILPLYENLYLKAIQDSK